MTWRRRDRGGCEMAWSRTERGEGTSSANKTRRDAVARCAVATPKSLYELESSDLSETYGPIGVSVSRIL